MDSKYNISSNKSPVPKFKVKPKPVLFNLNLGQPAAKKIKFDNISNGGANSKSNFQPYNNNKSPTKRTISLQEQRRSLPVFQNRNKLLELIERFNTLIILGETGSGKTTQIPQYILAAKLQNNGMIAITQPRRVAAISIAMRVAQEMANGLEVGDIVGYTVRFEDVTSKRTVIKFLTDGMLLREAILDKLLMKYTVIILDEAHERTINTDVLFGIVKQAQTVRLVRNLTPLKILLMSATMDVDHFSRYFNNCQAVYLEGRTFPVDIFYAVKAQEDYQTACVATFFKIHREAPPDEDVLIFLTGQEEIESVAHQIRTLAKDPAAAVTPNNGTVNGMMNGTGYQQLAGVRVCPLYAAQNSAQQMAVFQPTPPNIRKVIVATNIAETSITISGVRYVIDSGMVKMRTYYPTTGLDTLRVQRISQDQSWQRAGRAGRDSPGNCYRLYTRTQFADFSRTPIPEIMRAHLASTVLQLLPLGVNAMHFDFIDRPPRDACAAAFELIRQLGAIGKTTTGNWDDVELTTTGDKMAMFPLDPRYSKILLAAKEHECLDEVLTIVALLSGESIYLNPAYKREEIYACRSKFNSGYGDHITMLNVYREFNNVGQNNKRIWCHDHYINMKNMLYAREVRDQLAEICKRCHISISSCGGNMDQVRKCLLAGLFTHVAELQPRERHYITLDKRQQVVIHPSSVLHGQWPAHVMFTEVIQTTKCYLRNVTTIEVEWLHEVAPEYAKGKNVRLE